MYIRNEIYLFDLCECTCMCMCICYKSGRGWLEIRCVPGQLLVSGSISVRV